MKLIKFDLNKHDLNDAASLIYETDARTFNFYFKTKENATKKIKKLVIAGKNNLGHENIYVVTKEGEKQIFGLLMASTGDKEDIKRDFWTYFKTLNPYDALKFVLFDIVDSMILADLDDHDFYLGAVAVNEDCRGKGVGTFILKESLEIARKKNCKRVVLDVDLKNDGALRLYERFGFKIFNKKSIKWFGGEKGAFNLEYVMDFI
jgi:ribosomal protein S18 acetylase RimI-like enzyme